MEAVEVLWKPDDQGARLLELTSNDADTKEAPLRRDVRSLGRLLGDVIREQVGDALFDAVEELRQTATINPSKLEKNTPLKFGASSHT